MNTGIISPVKIMLLVFILWGSISEVFAQELDPSCRRTISGVAASHNKEVRKTTNKENLGFIEDIKIQLKTKKTLTTEQKDKLVELASHPEYSFAKAARELLQLNSNILTQQSEQQQKDLKRETLQAGFAILEASTRLHDLIPYYFIPREIKALEGESAPSTTLLAEPFPYSATTYYTYPQYDEKRDFWHPQGNYLGLQSGTYIAHYQYDPEPDRFAAVIHFLKPSYWLKKSTVVPHLSSEQREALELIAKHDPSERIRNCVNRALSGLSIPIE